MSILHELQYLAMPTSLPFGPKEIRLEKPQSINGGRPSFSLNSNYMQFTKQGKDFRSIEYEQFDACYSDDLLTELLISQTIVDSNHFKILTFDELNKFKKDLNDTQISIQNANKQIESENRIITISKTLENITLENSRHSAVYPESQRKQDERRLKYLNYQLENLKRKEIRIKNRLIKHTVAVLNSGIRSMEYSKLKNSKDKSKIQNITNEIKETNFRIGSICYQLNLNRTESNLTTCQKLLAVDQHLKKSMVVPTRNDYLYNKYKNENLHEIQSSKNILLSRLNEIQLQCDKSMAKVMQYPRRYEALTAELLQYKTESMHLTHYIGTREKEDLQLEKHSDYKQNIGDLIYKKNGKESLLNKTVKQKKKSINEELQNKNPIEDNCNDLSNRNIELERIIKEKNNQLLELIDQLNQSSHGISQPDSKIDTEKEMCELEKPEPDSNVDIEKKIHDLTMLIENKELCWIEHTKNLERNLNNTIENFDILANKVIENESTKRKFDTEIDALNENISSLETKIFNERINKMGFGDLSGSSNSTLLRKEFRLLVADLKSTHQRRMDRESNEIKYLHDQIRKIQSNRQDEQLQRYSLSIQTE